MTYFFNQKHHKCKKRYLINIVDIPINMKFIGNDNLNDLKDDETMNKPNSELSDFNISSQKILLEKSKQITLKKNYRTWSKISLNLLNELIELLNDRSICFNRSNIKIYSDFDELKLDSYYLISYDFPKVATTETLSRSNVDFSYKEKRQATAKDKNVIPTTNIVSENKINLPTIQFILSSEKCSNWIQDNNFHLTFSTIEWAITKLSISIKHKDYILETDKKNPYNTKPKIVFYNQLVKYLSTSNMYEKAKSLTEILDCLSYNLNMCLETENRNNVKPLEIISNDGTRSIMYPSGDIGILYFQDNGFHLLQVYNNNTKTLLAQFSNYFGGIIFWEENYNIRAIIDQNGCKIFDLNSEIVRDMKWPTNSNNKLSHSLNIRWNDHMTFYCSGKDSIIIKFDTNEEKNKSLEIKIHAWLFQKYNILTEKPVLLANVTYISQTATDLIKTVSIKQRKKEDVQKNEFNIQFEVKLNELKNDIRFNFDKWISFIKEKLQLEGKLTQRKVAKSASILRGKTVDFQIKNSDFVTSSLQRNISAPLRYINVERSLLNNKDTQRRMLSVKVKNTIELKEIAITSAMCPLKLRSKLLNKVPSDFSNDFLNPESCLCSKFSMTEITDLELSNFLRMISSNQLIIIGVINTRDDGLSEERLKERFIEDSLASLLSDLYEDDLRKSTQKPCLVYAHKPYRLYLYDIRNSGRFLNSTQSLLLRKHNILPGMCLMFKETKLLFADYIFNGYKSTKSDLFKQINLSEKLFKDGFYLPNDFQLNFNNHSKQWIEDTAYSKIKVYNYPPKVVLEDQLSSV